MAIIRCPECGHEISDKAITCPSCGVQIAGKITKCTHCGEVYFRDQLVCPSCHFGQTASAPRLQGSDGQAQASAPIVSDPGQPGPGRMADDAHEGTGTALPVHPRGKNNKVVIAVAAVIVLAVLGICYYFYVSANSDREREAYEYAMTSNDPEVLQNYLNAFADAPEAHRDSIEAHLSMLGQLDKDWTDAVVSGSRSAIENYLRQHPDTPHKAEAYHKLDSIDWCVASAANTTESYETYLEDHPDGEHSEEANDLMKGITAKTVQPEEKQMVSGVFQALLQCINEKDASSLPAIVNPLLNSFLGKTDATRNDVASFIRKIYKSDIASMSWKSLGDYNISKKEVGDGQYEYSVTFSVAETIEHTDATTEEVRYRISGKVSPNGLITEIGMTKLID